MRQTVAINGVSRKLYKLEHDAAHAPRSNTTREVALVGRRRPQAAANSLMFFTNVEGVEEYDGRVRSANGVRWRVA